QQFLLRMSGSGGCSRRIGSSRGRAGLIVSRVPQDHGRWSLGVKSATGSSSGWRWVPPAGVDGGAAGETWTILVATASAGRPLADSIAGRKPNILASIVLRSIARLNAMGIKTRVNIVETISP